MAQNPNGMSQLDMAQIVKRSFNPDNDELRVSATIDLGPGSEIIISQLDDSIAIGDGTSLYTGTTVGLDFGLDVNVVGGVVSGTFSPTGLSTGLRTQAILVTDAPTKVPASALVDRNGMSVRVWGTSVVYFGDSSVTSADGYPKKQFEEITIDITDNSAVDLWAVCDAGQTCELRILELA